MNPVTARQRQVLQMLADGATLRAIARRLGVSSTHTVDDHLFYLRRKKMIHAVKRKACPNRWTPTEAGWSELGRKICPTCQGHGTVREDHTPPAPPANRS